MPPEMFVQQMATSAPQQILDLLSSMKMMVQTNPDQCRALFTSNPQLAYAVFQW